jgi:hypothetical protein
MRIRAVGLPVPTSVQIFHAPGGIMIVVEKADMHAFHRIYRNLQRFMQEFASHIERRNLKPSIRIVIASELQASS